MTHDRAKTRIQIAAAVILGLLVLAGTLVEHHPYFGLDGVFAFNALLGFCSVAIMVVVARAFGTIVKREDDSNEH